MEKISEHVMVKYGKQFNELCGPILKSTPINYIGLARIYEDGSRSYLISNPAWGEILLRNKYHLAGTEDALIERHDTHHQLWSVSSMFALNQQTQNLFQDCVANNYGNGITLIERGSGFVEFVHLCSDSGYESVNPYLAHNIEQLWNHVLYIREALQGNKTLKMAYQHQYQYERNQLLNNEEKWVRKDNSLLEVNKYYLGGQFDKTYFTKREMECLILLCQNKTAKEQAAIFDLSHRTVEHILERIKIKAKCNSKTELILKLMSNNSFRNIVFLSKQVLTK